MARGPSYVLILSFTTVSLLAAQNPQDVQIRSQSAGRGVHMLTGQGGNIGVSVGPDGAFLVDDQYAPITEKIVGAVRALTEHPIRFVVNTHWHGDHTGGNENLGEAGALIVAHENVRQRMSVDQFIVAFNQASPASPPGALPVITFSDGVTFHWNGDEIQVFHVAAAHTDGDAIIHFERANVVHMGDVFFHGMYPFIDASSGGTLDGVVAAVDRVLGIANDQTAIIPGHGALATRGDLLAYRDMLVTVREHMRRLIAEGKTKEEIVAAKPTARFDGAWGGGYFEPDQWVGLVYDAMTSRERDR